MVLPDGQKRIETEFADVPIEKRLILGRPIHFGHDHGHDFFLIPIFIHFTPPDPNPDVEGEGIIGMGIGGLENCEPGDRGLGEEVAVNILFSFLGLLTKFPCHSVVSRPLTTDT